jgi:hydroxypyruvate isomerase
MPKFAANLTMLFSEIDFLDRFEAAARCGFTGVEYLFPYGYEKDRLVEALETYNLNQVLHNLPAGNWAEGDRGIACDPNRIGEFQDGVGKALDYARALKCTQLNCLAGKVPPKVTPDQAHRTFVENVTFASRALAADRINLLIEAVNTSDVPGFFLNRTAQALSIIDESGCENLLLQYDIYHMQIMEGNLATTMAKNLSRIAHIQVADVPGRHEPGTGEINFPFLFGFLDRAGYTGWIGCEYNPASTTEKSLGWLNSHQSQAAQSA